MEILRKQYPLVYAIVEKIIAHNGKSYLVGGAVRDIVMHLPVKDIDIEIHGLSEHQLEAIMSQYGPVSLTGKSFGVLRLHGLDADWSLPRTDSAGRKPVVTINPAMSIEDAARRRDLTMNAMAIDLQSDELIDPFGGMADIKNKILRTPDAQLFLEDPLRFYRVMQFVGRFEMQPDDELSTLCSHIDITGVSRERIEQECKKLLLLSRRPSLGVRWINDIGRLHEILPELAATLAVKQNPQWHPEGNVFEHLMQTLDAAATIVRSYDDERNKLILLYAALCHDLGKVTTTTCCNGVIKSIGHERDIAGVKTMMKRITHESELISAITSLVLHHMAPLQFIANNAKLPAYKRLACKLVSSVSIALLADLACADRCGRNGNGHEPLPGPCRDVELFAKKAKKAGVFERKEAAIVTGADLLAFITPGPRMGQLIAKAYEIQINDGITDKMVLLERVMGKKIK